MDRQALDPLLKQIEAYEMSTLLVRKISNDVQTNQTLSNEKIHRGQFWIDLFIKQFLIEDQQIHDDLLFFVRHQYQQQLQSSHPTDSEPLELYRRDSKRMPIGDCSIDWKRTVYLNYILQSFSYKIICAVCKKVATNLQILNYHSVEVFACPSSRKMNLTKPREEKITYPDIYFSVDGFDDFLDKISVDSDEIVCIELIATNKETKKCSSIFLGSMNHSLLMKSLRQKMFPSCVSPQLDRFEPNFIFFRGPGAGKAEMAVIESEWVKCSTLPESQKNTLHDSASAISQCLDLDCDDFRVSLDKRRSYLLRMLSRFAENPFVKRSDKFYKSSRSYSSGNIAILNDSDMTDNEDNVPYLKPKLSSRRCISPVLEANQLNNQNRLSNSFISGCSRRQPVGGHVGNNRRAQNVKALNFCLPSTQPNLIIEDMKTLNAFVTRISMNWTNILENIKVGRGPVLTTSIHLCSKISSVGQKKI